MMFLESNKLLMIFAAEKITDHDTKENTDPNSEVDSTEIA